VQEREQERMQERVQEMVQERVQKRRCAPCAARRPCVSPAVSEVSEPQRSETTSSSFLP
jgi:sulfur relay (sulfurtransferase) complex TusBCD TusD component (DsrE family)